MNRKNSKAFMHSFRARILLTGFLISSSFSGRLDAQTASNYIPNVIPPSPNAASLMKFSDVPVSPYTGAVDITVPIYTIQARGVSVPISLDYHTGGIRVKEESGWVGLGWALNAGGMISRTIMDYDDFGSSEPTYFNTTLQQLPGDLTAAHPPAGRTTYMGIDEYDFVCNYLVNTTSGTYDLYSALTGGHGYDMEPDIYSYNFLGRSGKFMITRAGKVILQKQDNIRIQFETNGNSFTITDESGNRYLYYDKEYTQPATGFPAPAISTWALSKIITQQNDTVSFTYVQNGYSTVKGDLTETFNYGCSNAGYYSDQAAGTNYLNQTLSTIDFSNGQIQFSFDALRKDLANSRKLNAVKIYSKSASGALSYVKEYDLFYSYFNANFPSTDTLEYTRLKLDSVKELSGTLSLPPYSFVYNNQSDQLPAKHSNQVDHWGFYNALGGSGTSLLPSMTIWWDPPGYVYPGQYFTYNGANRNPNPNPAYTNFFSLQQITYPTGGKTVLELEPNDYDYHSSITGPSDFLDPNLVNVLIAKNITARGTTTGTISFSHITPLLPSGSPNTNATLNVGFIYSTNGNYTYSNSIGKIYVTLVGPGINITIDAGNVGTGPGQLTCGGPACSVTIPLTITSFGNYTWTAYIDPTVGSDFSLTRVNFGWQETETDYQADNNLNIISLASGLRVKSITDYKDASTPAKKRIFNYSYMADKQGTGTPSKYSYGRLMAFPSYVRNTLVPMTPSGTCYGLSVTSSTNTSLTSVIQGNVVGYDQVEEYNIDPVTNTDIGKTVYKYYNISDSTTSYGGFRLPGAFNMGNSLNGSLLSKIESANNAATYKRVSETDNFYHTANRIVYFSPKVEFSASSGSGGSGGFCPADTGVQREVTASFYPSIKSERILLDSTNEILYDQFDTTKFIFNKKYFYYDNALHYLLTRSGSTDSKGNTYISQMKYPQDYIPNGLTWTSNTILDSLIGRNMVAGVIEKRDSLYYTGTTTSGKITGAQLSKYKFLTAGAMGMDKQYRMDLAGPISNFQPYSVTGNTTSQDTRYRQLISFDSYDNTNNIAQYTAIDQTPVAIVWDYKNLYPIAQVKNAVLTDVAFTSFEADGNGNWTIASATRDTVNFITGKKSYNMSNGSVSKSGLVSGRVYMVTYWSKTGAAYTITGGTTTSRTGRVVNGWTYIEQTVTATSTTISMTGSGNIDELRLYPKGSLMTSYTYSSLVGVTTMNDVNSEITYYEYDALTRLKNVKDYLGNIIKNYQYNEVNSNSCGTNCTVISMLTLANSSTLSYPVGVFNINGKLLGNALNQTQYITIWMTDTLDSHTGTIAVGSDSMHFKFTVNSGRATPNALTGCRYYQYDLPYTQIDGISPKNGVYVDFGDTTGMYVGKSYGDTNVVRAPNTVYGILYGYWIHTYHDASTKTITIYHNDATETVMLDNNFNPGTSLTLLRNLRGVIPQNTQLFGGDTYQQSSVLTNSGMTNWGSISSILNFMLKTGDALNPCMHVSYPQDFMANNKNLQSIITNSRGYYLDGYEDSTFKISRLKSGWNTYFTKLNTLEISDDHWNREDLSALTQLKTVAITAGNQKHSYNQTNNPLVPIPTNIIDNIINQISSGAGQLVTNGLLVIWSGGTSRSTASDAGFNNLKAKGWTITFNGINY